MAKTTPPDKERSRPRGLRGGQLRFVKAVAAGGCSLFSRRGQPRSPLDRVLRALFLSPATHASDDTVTADFGCDHACGHPDDGASQDVG